MPPHADRAPKKKEKLVAKKTRLLKPPPQTAAIAMGLAPAKDVATNAKLNVMPQDIVHAHPTASAAIAKPLKVQPHQKL